MSPILKIKSHSSNKNELNRLRIQSTCWKLFEFNQKWIEINQKLIKIHQKQRNPLKIEKVDRSCHFPSFNQHFRSKHINNGLKSIWFFSKSDYKFNKKWIKIKIHQKLTLSFNRNQIFIVRFELDQFWCSNFDSLESQSSIEIVVTLEIV